MVEAKENISEEVERAPSEHASLVGLNDAADEFFDVPESSDLDDLDTSWTSDFGPETYSQVLSVKFVKLVGVGKQHLASVMLYSAIRASV